MLYAKALCFLIIFQFRCIYASRPRLLLAGDVVFRTLFSPRTTLCSRFITFGQQMRIGFPLMQIFWQHASYSLVRLVDQSLQQPVVTSVLESDLSVFFWAPPRSFYRSFLRTLILLVDMQSYLRSCTDFMSADRSSPIMLRYHTGSPKLIG